MLITLVEPAQTWLPPSPGAAGAAEQLMDRPVVNPFALLVVEVLCIFVYTMVGAVSHLL
jgi:hypothetical protein